MLFCFCQKPSFKSQYSNQNKEKFYFLIDEDEDMPTKLSFAKKIKIDELV